MAATLLDHVRGADAAARLGGDEFALLLPHCDAQAGLMLAQRICDAVSRLGVNFGAEWLGVGASIGVVSMDPGTSIKAADWKARADAACYEAKHQGRGRACLARPGPALQLVG